MIKMNQNLLIKELQAKLVSKIINEKRFFAEYYRVGYYGKGFDKNLRGREFIYRGLELEMRQEFVERITKLFPNAEVLSYTDGIVNIFFVLFCFCFFWLLLVCLIEKHFGFLFDRFKIILSCFVYMFLFEVFIWFCFCFD